MKKVVLLTLIALSFVGCNPNKESSKRTSGNGGRVATISGTTNGAFTQSYCGNNLSSVGTIYDQSSSFTSNFEARVKGLLSATIDPSEVGTISAGANDQTGVRFQGTFKIESNGTVNLQQTKILIKVYDSYVLQSATDGSNQYQPIPIEFSSAAAGQFNMQTGSGYVVFRDEYGEVRFDGNLSGDYLSGQVSFVNTTNVTGGAAAQGVLGQFYIARCGIIK
ncbi:hypothetical protein [Pseudobdellovibrio sp. HCB154]|uniref:hypothetical protein n=1 Tax=Pseudobdellovibrio sp. HCB154 TaxID=3386277 RepID=UPI0039173E3B